MYQGESLDVLCILDNLRKSKTMLGKVGQHSFVEEYVVEKVMEWAKEIEQLSNMAKSQPQAAHTVLTRG